MFLRKLLLFIVKTFYILHIKILYKVVYVFKVIDKVYTATHKFKNVNLKKIINSSHFHLGYGKTSKQTLHVND